jgi:glucose/arabinose dehydrogenase
MKWRSVLLLLILLRCAASASAQSLTDSSLRLQTYRAFELDESPVSIAFLGNHDLLTVHKNSGQVIRTIGSSGTNPNRPVVLDLPVNSDSERGLLDIALHPNFGMEGQPNNDKVYLYYSRNSTANDSTVDGVWLENRLSRFTWNGSALVNEVVLQTFGTNSDGQTQGPNHDGGPITFGPDGKLYGITGDLNRNRAEQNNEGQPNSTSFVGGVYRLNDDGTVPGDNPFSSHSNSAFHRWYAYGIRNSFGLAFDPVTDFLWDTENGPGTMDEVNLIAPGFNSGWNDIMGPDALDPQGTGNLLNLAAGGVSTYSDPEFSWLDTNAPTAIHFMHGSVFGPAYDDKVLVADNNRGQIYMFTLDAARDGFVLSGSLADLLADNNIEADQLRFGLGFGALTDIIRGPDGHIYFVDLGSSRVYRIYRKPGDYNDNNVVDAADYIRWREANGTTTTLPNDFIGGTIGPAHYNQWREHFGEILGTNPVAGASSGGLVPEPATALLLAMASLVGYAIIRARRLQPAESRYRFCA